MFNYYKYLLIISSLCIGLQTVQADETNIAVSLVTSYGSIDIELYQNEAPITVTNFLKYLDAGSYDGGVFKRTVRHDNDNGHPKINVIQGAPKADIKLLDAIKLETTEQTGIKHTDGVISMARSEHPDSAQDEFFITINPQPSLDFGGMRNKDGQGFAAFGKVIKGMDIVRKINEIRDTKEDTDPYVKGQILANPVKIIRAVRK